MTLKQALRIITLSIMLVLMAVYFYLNAGKLEILKIASDRIVNGPTVRPVSVRMGKVLVYAGSLPSSDIHDSRGEKQINFLQLTDELLAMVKTTGRRLVVSLGEESAPALPYGNQGLLIAEFSDRTIRVFAESNSNAIIHSIYQDRLQSRDIVECLDQAACTTVKLQSDQWNEITGPYLNTDINPDRRGLPKGRWLFGPSTELQLHSESEQTVQLLIYLFSTLPQQQVRFEGEAVVKTNEFQMSALAQVAGRMHLFPRAFMLELQLEQGKNPINVVFSSALQPTQRRTLPLAAYLTRVRIKTVVN